MRRNSSLLVAPDHLLGIGEAVVAELVAEGFLAQFAGRGMRKLVDKFDRVGQPPFGDLPGQVIADAVGADVAARRADGYAVGSL